MNKRIISAVLALIICLSLTTCAFAVSDTSFVADDLGYLAENEVADLNNLAAELYDTYGVGIFFIFTTEEWLEGYDISKLVNDMEDYVIMLENDTSWFTFYGGEGERIDLSTEEELRSVYDAAETYVGGVNDFLLAAAELFPRTVDTPEADVTESNVPELSAEEQVLFDEAYLLSESEQAELTEKLLGISHTYNAQIVVATIASMDGGDIDDFVEYIYDSMGFGYGANNDGVLLLVCMDPREYRILSNGFAGVAIDTGDIDDIGDRIVSDLSDGNYSAAFEKFADRCEYYLNGHLNGFPFNVGKTLLICLVIGILCGVIVALLLKHQLKTVRKQNQASVYVKQGSMQVTQRNDFFLYRDVTRTKKESSNSSGSKSSRSVGGGSF